MARITVVDGTMDTINTIGTPADASHQLKEKIEETIQTATNVLSSFRSIWHCVSVSRTVDVSSPVSRWYCIFVASTL